MLQTDNGGVRRTGAELSFRTVTRRVLTVTEPSNGFVRSARRTGGAGLGSLLEFCEVELARVDGGREIEPAAPIRQSRASAKPSAAQAATNRTILGVCELLGLHASSLLVFRLYPVSVTLTRRLGS